MRRPPGAINIIAVLALGGSVWGCAEGAKDGEVAPDTSRAQAQPAPPSAPTTEEFLGLALQGDVAALGAAIAAGVDLHATTAEGATALMLASFQGHTEAVRALLQRGAKVSDLDQSGRTALMYASSGPFAETVDLLIEAGSEVNRVDTVEEWTALMFASGEGATEVVRTLLNHGADPGLADSDGETALTFAQRNRHEAAYTLLKEAMNE